MLEARQLECLRGDKQLFVDLDFTLTPGHCLLLEGPNGSGKTSLLRILAGLSEAESGELRWQGRNLRGRMAQYRDNLAWLGHSAGLKAELSGEENLRFFARLYGQRRGIGAALARVGLAGREQLPVRSYSAGQRRRLALARLLLRGAPLWLLDEPYTALDSEGMALVDSLLGEHLTGGGLAVISSHQRPRASLPLQQLRLGGPA
ncbi:cytochrome c biogenesis heme-transporting ATPase CcmA [Alkalilimnicola sp. S0819]|uniref:cytochrome c biogenesis heme-transporting ATPase CcmA n=1 Tax=Alkalilimnicola sp. S0819 TaxID=2613922 RepID=UPI001261C340|nr:cytochrome c biogenesis heme-transporting ATPase CcmA [Alkalilimnicola sp. S0819]KAB7627494.1 cytochrome c biogenesis heme-transporting ATPase CcmA [Alkalilimnicola sp. S0819]MPQ15647.1 cytochrome c biogenesis heme-transporting ATPase CcmA [Alkalilimnicola sp. S0819]